MMSCTQLKAAQESISPSASIHACTAWGGSHTGKYTFRIDPVKCTVRWLEIERNLDVLECGPSRLIAAKPFAPAEGYVLKFNLQNGRFSDHVPGWADRGKCTQMR